MAKTSAGLLLYRAAANGLEVFIVHPGGPFWAKKDAGAWSLPKGEFDPHEDALQVARREFTEETGFAVDGEFRPLTPRRQPGGKTIHAWAVRGDCDATAIRSNTFSIEWPPRSGRRQEFPEVDRAGWFAPAAAQEKLLAGQRGFIDELLQLLENGAAP